MARITERVELVSSHYGYTEEYVLDHSWVWLERKFYQAMREKFEASRLQVMNQFKGIAMALDMVLNKGKAISSIVPPTFDEYLEEKKKEEETKREYRQDLWWKVKK